MSFRAFGGSIRKHVEFFLRNLRDVSFFFLNLRSEIFPDRKLREKKAHLKNSAHLGVDIESTLT